MKEKLQFVERENSSLTGELGDVDDQLAGQRGALTALKATRDVMRTKQRSFKDTTLNITNPQLLRDMEVGWGGVGWGQRTHVCNMRRMAAASLQMLGADQ
jgi:hypothetical protein